MEGTMLNVTLVVEIEDTTVPMNQIEYIIKMSVSKLMAEIVDIDMKSLILDEQITVRNIEVTNVRRKPL